MKTKFNKYERMAGLFVIGAVLGGAASAVGVAIKRGWFEPKAQLETSLTSAEGLHAGTQVLMAGLRAGSVESVELGRDNEVRVRFEISKKFMGRVREDSVVRVFRPFVIGEKALEVSVGADDAKPVAEGAKLKSEASLDIMDMMSGRTLGGYLAAMGKMMENLKVVADAFMDPERSKAIVKIFDEIGPLLKNANRLTKETNGLLGQVNKDQKLATMVQQLAAITQELHAALPAAKERAPEMAQDLAKIAKNMAILTDELQKTLPLLAQVAPEMPRASRRALEALDETVVVLKALQKSFLLRGNVRDVRDEEAKREQERLPASEGGKGAGHPDEEARKK